MAFIGKEKKGVSYRPGFFLANQEHCTRETHNFKDDGNTGTVDTVGTAKYVAMGRVYPKNDDTAIGIVYEDVDVSNGEAAGSVVTRGVVYEDRLADTIDESAKTALTGIQFIEKAPTVIRPVL